MNRDDVTWQGYWPACPTPFHRDGSYDPASHRALLELYLGLGVHGVLINGTTGEWFSQTADERRLVAETAIDQVAGRIPLVVGCAAYTAKEAADLGRHAIAAGAAGVESTPPPYAKTYDDETVAYYEDLANGVDGPLRHFAAGLLLGLAVLPVQVVVPRRRPYHPTKGRRPRLQLPQFCRGFAVVVAAARLAQDGCRKGDRGAHTEG